MASQPTVAIIFGGQSGEHEVSLQSANSIAAALDTSKYDIKLIGIDKSGRWLLGEDSTILLNPDDPSHIQLNQSVPQVIAQSTPSQTTLITTDAYKSVGGFDIAFPIIHGTTGEDGRLQGLLEMLDVPYVGAGVLGAAIGMDKVIMKRLLRDVGLPIGDFVALKRHLVNPDTIQQTIDHLGFPIFVKPANLGSSVGITKAHDEKELNEAINLALQYDHKIILEKSITGREIELSVLGNDTPIASVPGEVKPHHEFYSYDAKYIDENGAALQIPADLPEKTVKQLQDLAIKAFTTLECSGMARVDFFVTDDQQIYINEINTHPGFTKISMYPKLWEATGIPYAELLDRLIELAIERHQQKHQLTTDYSKQLMSDH